MTSLRLLAGSAASCALYFGVVAGADALSLNDFDNLVDYQQENFISTVLHYEYYRYKNDPQSAHKAECMVELDRAASDGDGPRLLSLIMRSLDQARINGARDPTVEGLIRDVIERECKAP